MYEEWRCLQKHCKWKTPTDEQNEPDFKEKLDNIFDMKHANTLDLMKIEEDKQFLLYQRLKRKVDTLLGIDKKDSWKGRKEKKTFKTGRRTPKKILKRFSSG